MFLCYNICNCIGPSSIPYPGCTITLLSHHLEAKPSTSYAAMGEHYLLAVISFLLLTATPYYVKGMELESIDEDLSPHIKQETIVENALNLLDLFLLPESTSPGGRCMDGTMAGYYIRNGSDEDLFIIDLRGGGRCTTKIECDKRNATNLGSSNDWAPALKGSILQNPNCELNPDFCNAMAVQIPYCTSDTHRGNVTEPSNETWGYYFDGHANFVAIIEKLILEHGLGDAKQVLLTGGSSGGIGTFFNIDWLAERLPNASVKGVTTGGWFLPGALPDDLPSIFAPSDFVHFNSSTYGNAFYDSYMADGEPFDLFQLRDTLPADCIADRNEDEWWACESIHQAYRYIKSPLFTMQPQYDGGQIFKHSLTPRLLNNYGEAEMVEKYIEMWGEATRASLQMILDDDVIADKQHPDGLFAASCIEHETVSSVEMNGQNWINIVHDWFFQLGELTEYHRLVEECPAAERKLPCNEKYSCRYEPSIRVPPMVKSCVTEMKKKGCLRSFSPENECIDCVRDNKGTIAGGGCTDLMMTNRICAFAENNTVGLENIASGLHSPPSNDSDTSSCNRFEVSILAMLVSLILPILL